MDSDKLIDLGQFEFRPLIDFVTIETPGKIDLPELEGRPVWVASDHYRQLAIHDLQPTDVVVLERVLPAAKIVEAEVAIDLVPTTSKISCEERAKMLDD